MKRFEFLILILIYLLGSGTGVYGVTPQEAVNAFVSSPGTPSSVAVMVSDLSTGKVLASHNASTPLVPASIMKTVSIASLSDMVDMDSRISTKCYLEGNNGKMGVFEGNLLIEGAGDPSLNSTVWPKSNNFIKEITDALKARGITSIQGDIIIKEDYFKGASIPDSWQQGDLSRAYGTGSHSFNYANNASGNSSVANPAAVFKSELQKALSADGITLGKLEYEGGKCKLLVIHESPEIKELMRSCMMRSDNLYAEAILRRFGKARGGDGSTADAAGREMNLWRGRLADMSGVNIVDGSGLSRSNRVTAQFMENVLRMKSGDVEYVSFFPLAGQEGTLRSFLKGTKLDSYIAMKTGSMNGIQCYAGYKLDDDFAPTHVVVVIVNNFKCSRDALRKNVEKMLLDIF